MAREHMCDFGSCENHNTPIVMSVTDNGGIQRKWFCCMQHAAAWSLASVIKNKENLNWNTTKERDLLVRVDNLIRDFS